MLHRRKKSGERKLDVFRHKLMIPDSEITECPEYKIKSKTGNIFLNEKILKEYTVKIYETDPYLMSITENKIQVDEHGYKYILFRTDVYFNEYVLAVEIDEKSHTDRDLNLRRKDKKH